MRYLIYDARWKTDPERAMVLEVCNQKALANMALRQHPVGSVAVEHVRRDGKPTGLEWTLEVEQ